jgi:hypothetical protein
MDGASVAIPGLPTGYPAGGDLNLRMTLDGWYSTSAIRSNLAASTSGGGSTPTGPWDHAEAYYTLRGVYHSDTADRGALNSMRRAIIAALPANRDTALQVLDDQDLDLTAFVRLYDKPDIEIDGPNLRFTLPLVAPDPLKYGDNLIGGMVSGDFGVFTGSQWFETFQLNTVPNPDRWWGDFTLDTAPTPDRGYSVFTQAQSVSPFPPAVVLVAPSTIDGGAISRRLMIGVTGPLTQGDWVITNETTGAEIYADLGLDGSQTVVFDSFTQTATLNGTDISNAVYGDYLSLQPGTNTFRLVSGQQSAGFATIIQALPAYS